MKIKKWLKYFLMATALVAVLNTGVNSTTIPAAAKSKAETVKVGSKFKEGNLQYKVTSLKGKTGTAMLIGTSSKKLTSVNVPETVKTSKYTLTVTEIGANAFKNCKKLENVTTNTKIKKIGKNAFSGCKNLAEVDIKSKNLKSVGKNALKGISKKAVVNVPEGKSTSYEKLLKVSVEVPKTASESKTETTSEPKTETKPETVPDSKAESKAENVSASGNESKAETKAETESKAKTEAKAETEAAAPKTEVKPETEAAPKTEVKPETEAAPKAEVKPETEAAAPKTEVKPETEAAPKTEVKPETEAAAPQTEVKPETEAAPKTEVKPETETAPKTEVKPETEAAAPKTEVKPETEAAPKTEVKPETEAAAPKTEVKPETEAAPKTEVKPETEATTKAETKPETEAATPKAEVKPETEAVAPKTEVKPETEAAPKVETKPETEAAPKAEVKPETEAVAPQTEVKSETEAAPKVETKPETEAAPKAEVKPETEAAPETEATPKTEVKSETEAAPKTEVKPETENKLETEAKAETEAKPETEANPKAETTPKNQEVPAETVPDTEKQPTTEKPAVCGTKHLGLKVVESVAPTCTEPGLSSYEYCTVCGYKTEPIVIQAVGHDLVQHAEVPATCTSKGKTAYVTCRRCSYATTPQEIAKLAHSYGNWSVVKEASCTEAGTEERSCVNCSKKETRSTALKEHTFGEWTTEQIPNSNCYERMVHSCTICNYVEKGNPVHKTDVYEHLEDIPATCTTPGKTNRTYCPYCRAENFSYVKPLGHDFSSKRYSEEGTCVKPGITYRECTRCGARTDVQETSKPSGHQWRSEKTLATCTEPGFEGQICDVCGEKEGKVTNPTGHKYDVKTITEATCEEPGKIEMHCSVCNATEETITPAIGGSHQWVAHAEEPATCSKPGLSAYTQCSVCKKYKDKEPEIIPATGKHDWGPAYSLYSIINAAQEPGAESGTVSSWNDVFEECRTCGKKTITAAAVNYGDKSNFNAAAGAAEDAHSDDVKTEKGWALCNFIEFNLFIAPKGSVWDSRVYGSSNFQFFELYIGNQTYDCYFFGRRATISPFSECAPSISPGTWKEVTGVSSHNITSTKDVTEKMPFWQADGHIYIAGQ